MDRANLRQVWFLAAITVLLALSMTPSTYALTAPVKSGGVNVRSCPSTSCSIVRFVPAGTRITVTGCATGTVVSGDPYWLYYPSGPGWVADSLISCGGVCSVCCLSC